MNPTNALTEVGKWYTVAVGEGVEAAVVGVDPSRRWYT